jgi:hypothetical protein
MRPASTAGSTSGPRQGHRCSHRQAGSSPSRERSRWVVVPSPSTRRTATRSRSCTSAPSPCGAARLWRRAAPSGPSARAARWSYRCPTCTSAYGGAPIRMGTSTRCRSCPTPRSRPSSRRRPASSPPLRPRPRPRPFPRSRRRPFHRLRRPGGRSNQRSRQVCRRPFPHPWPRVVGWPRLPRLRRRRPVGEIFMAANPRRCAPHEDPRRPNRCASKGRRLLLACRCGRNDAWCAWAQHERLREGSRCVMRGAREPPPADRPRARARAAAYP